MTIDANRVHRITPRRMLVLRSRLHLAKKRLAWASALAGSVDARLREANALVRGDEAAGYEDIAVLDRRVATTLARLLESCREERDAAAESVIRIEATIDRAAFAQFMSAQEPNDAA